MAVQKDGKKKPTRDWDVWLETRLVNGYYPPDALSKKAFYLYVAMVRRAGVRNAPGPEGGAEPTWLTSLARNAFVTDTGLPIEAFGPALEELEIKHFVRRRPDASPTPAYLKGPVYEILRCPRYDKDAGFLPESGARELATAIEHVEGLDVEGGERPIFFFPAGLIDRGSIKRLRSLKLLRLLLWLYSAQRLDTDMGVPPGALKVRDLGLSLQSVRKVGIPNLNYLLDPAVTTSGVHLAGYLDHFIEGLSDVALRATGMTRKEALAGLADLCGAQLLHFALVERTPDPEDPDILMKTVLNPVDNERRAKQSRHKLSKLYVYRPRPGAHVYYVAQLVQKPKTVETVRYLHRVEDASSKQHRAEVLLDEGADADGET